MKRVFLFTQLILLLALVIPFASQAEKKSSKQKPGRLKVSYTKPLNPELKDIYRVLRDSQAFNEIVDYISDTVVLPQNIPVAFEQCDMSNAFYNPETVKISMCYELISDMAKRFGEPEDTDEEISADVFNAALFTLLHEIGHALIDQLDIPITGKEEDSVDDLAVVLLLDEMDEGQSAAMSAMMHFAYLASEFEESADSIGQIPFWDEHSLNPQRVYSIACLVFGSDPEGNAGMVGDDKLPPERAARCQAEYEQKSRSWERLLEPYRQNMEEEEAEEE